MKDDKHREFLSDALCEVEKYCLQHELLKTRAIIITSMSFLNCDIEMNAKENKAKVVYLRRKSVEDRVNSAFR